MRDYPVSIAGIGRRGTGPQAGQEMVQRGSWRFARGDKNLINILIWSQ